MQGNDQDDTIEINELQYEILNSKQDNYNNLLWSTPVLFLTALSFLFTIIFSMDINKVQELLILSILSFLVSIFSMHLFMKLRFLETRISKMLEHYESQRKDLGLISKRPKKKIRKNIFFAVNDHLVNLSAYGLFMFLFLLFALISGYKIITTLKLVLL